MAPEITPDHIMQIGMGFEASKTLLSAVELGVFTELAKAPGDVTALRERLGLHPRGAQDFFDTLVALGLLRRVGGIYHNTEETARFLDRGNAEYNYCGSLLEMANGRLYGIWGSLTEALRTGIAQDESKATGQDTYGALYADRERLRQFLASMTGVSHAANLAIARQFPWKDYSTVADMGTAQGDLATQILLANPHLSGVGFDLPPTGPIFADYIAGHGLQDRLTFVGGDFFVDDFPRADVIAFGHILHNWDQERKELLLARAWQALPSGGAVVVYDTLIDDDRSANAFALLMSLTMLSVTDGGFGYTAADCERWLRAAGFSQIRTEHLTGPDSMVVGIKE
ncbi:methyltransferase [Parafrankia sp. FMc2]|uniref:methyltransferase n=1 Tax=Parafrankia sp. FMc2 TaxID=3233196 RepID=UPI0034D7572E